MPGDEVRLANPAKIQQYNGLKHADDRSDAFFLAELLRLEILPTGHICERKWRAVRDRIDRHSLGRRMRFIELTGRQRRNRLGINEPEGSHALGARWFDVVSSFPSSVSMPAVSDSAWVAATTIVRLHSADGGQRGMHLDSSASLMRFSRSKACKLPITTYDSTQ